MMQLKMNCLLDLKKNIVSTKSNAIFDQEKGIKESFLAKKDFNIL
jgi:hypothetical protein